MGEKNFKMVKFGIYHNECPWSETTEKFPEIKIRQLSPVHVINHGTKGTYYQILTEISAPTNKELDAYFSMLKKYKGMNNEMLKKEANKAWILFKDDIPTSSYEAVIKQGAHYTTPVHAQNGYEYHTVITTTPKGMQKLLNEMKEIGELRVLKIGELSQEKEGNLTAQQFGALKDAFLHGYYSWPRKATLEEIAGYSKISRRAFQERLRKAEAKMFPKMIQDLMLSEPM